jgi:hypothetical protein
VLTVAVLVVEVVALAVVALWVFWRSFYPERCRR